MRIRTRRICAHVLRGGNDREVATIFSGSYPAVLSQLTITNTIKVRAHVAQRSKVELERGGNDGKWI